MDPAARRRTNLLIVYGTATGTAREVAQRIAREAYSFAAGEPPVHYFLPEVLSMKDVSISYLVDNWQDEQCKVLFVVSTTGQGEFPDDSKKFWRELCRKSNVPQISIRYGVIGLGDSSYELYNYPGKKLHRRLSQLSATPELDLCLCDDQHDLGYVGALNPFLEACWDQWIPEEFKASRNAQPVARYTLSDIKPDGGSGSPGHIDVCKVEQRAFIRNDRVTAPDHYQDTRLIAFDTTNSDLKFEEGDALQVFAENFPENVELFFDIFPSLKNQPPFYLICDPQMSWESIPVKLLSVCGPQPWTWEKVALQLLDLQSIPGVYVFEVLRSFTNDPLLEEKFEEFCRPEGLEELYNYVNRPRRTILEVLQDFPNAVADLPMNYIFDIIPFMRPRAFSIASPSRETNHIEILVAIVEFKTNLKKLRKGTCSYWLAHHCKLGQKVSVYCERGSLRPPTTNCHMIMVGPGTGVAPFRSMIKQHLNEWDKHLFFGCRNKDKDYYFGDEFETLTREGNMIIYPAFSRDHLERKVDYVQDVIHRQSGLIKSMLESPLPLYIYVCGRSGDMPKDVWSAFKTILEGLGVSKSEELLKSMLNSGQYQTETY